MRSLVSEWGKALPAKYLMKCPICRKHVDESEPGRPATFPFCSERCKLIDLGRWLSGKYQIPVVEEDESSASSASPDSYDASRSPDSLLTDRDADSDDV